MLRLQAHVIGTVLDPLGAPIPQPTHILASNPSGSLTHTLHVLVVPILAHRCVHPCLQLLPVGAMNRHPHQGEQPDLAAYWPKAETY